MEGQLKMQFNEEVYDKLDVVCKESWRLDAPKLFSFEDGNCIEIEYGLKLALQEVELKGVIIAESASEAALLLAIGDIECGDGDNFLFLCSRFFNDVVSANQNLESLVAHARDFLSCVEKSQEVEIFDVEKQDSSIAPIPNATTDSFAYVAEMPLPGPLAYAFCRDKFMSLVANLVNRSFFIMMRLREKEHPSDDPLKDDGISFSLPFTLASAILPGEDFSALEAPPDVPLWQGSALGTLYIEDGDKVLGEEYGKLFHKIKRLEDVISLWDDAHRQEGWTLCLEPKDFEEDALERTKRKLSELFELLGMKSYIDTYNSGVPVADILA